MRSLEHRVRKFGIIDYRAANSECVAAAATTADRACRESPCSGIRRLSQDSELPHARAVATCLPAAAATTAGKANRESPCSGIRSLSQDSELRPKQGRQPKRTNAHMPNMHGHASRCRRHAGALSLPPAACGTVNAAATHSGVEAKGRPLPESVMSEALARVSATSSCCGPRGPSVAFLSCARRRQGCRQGTRRWSITATSASQSLADAPRFNAASINSAWLLGMRPPTGGSRSRFVGNE